MKIIISTLWLVLLLSSCMPPRVSPDKLHAHYQAHAMDKLNQMQYMGTKGNHHYFHHFRISMMKREYRVRKDQLFIKGEFPLTGDRDQWRPYKVVKLESDLMGVSLGVSLIPISSLPLEFNTGPTIDEIQPILR